MSQLYTYFGCSPESIERWADVLAGGDEAAQKEVEAAMPFVTTLKNVGNDDLNILARCVGGAPFVVAEAVGEIDLVREISNEGSWVMALRRSVIEAVAGMRTDSSLLQRWARYVASFNGIDKMYGIDVRGERNAGHDA